MRQKSRAVSAAIIFFTFVVAVMATFTLTANSAKAAHYLDGAPSSIWVDPDGCQHFAIYNGWQGDMTPNYRPDGTVVCANAAPQTCMIASSDQLFATGQYYINAGERRRLEDFFRNNGSRGFAIAGHTDSVGGSAYNDQLSYNRANAVAEIARSAGANVVSVRGFGKRQPRATNATADGRALNRRVEIQCIN
ncbi:outer membrane porin F precursor [mine drainage metagenome]|uniref:Outer membrane porin F n=1 Tax=mine drainage metagenome TaxID=410659 RepID=A0A1J5NYQ9_9ZZZZ